MLDPEGRSREDRHATEKGFTNHDMPRKRLPSVLSQECAVPRGSERHRLHAARGQPFEPVSRATYA